MRPISILFVALVCISSAEGGDRKRSKARADACVQSAIACHSQPAQAAAEPAKAASVKAESVVVSGNESCSSGSCQTSSSASSGFPLRRSRR